MSLLGLAVVFGAATVVLLAFDETLFAHPSYHVPTTSGTAF